MSYNELAASLTSTSTMGFVILLALPAIVQATWSGMEDILAYSDYISFRTKFVFLLGRSKCIGVFCVSAIFFLLSGLLSQFYVMYHYSDLLIQFALLINISATSASLGAVISTVCFSVTTSSKKIRLRYVKEICKKELKNSVQRFTEKALMEYLQENRIHNRIHNHIHVKQRRKCVPKKRNLGN